MLEDPDDSPRNDWYRGDAWRVVWTLLIVLAAGLISSVLASCASPPPRDLDAELEHACAASGIYDRDLVLRCKAGRLDTIEKCMFFGYPAGQCIRNGLIVTGR